MICQKGGLVSFPFRKLPEHSGKRSTVAKSHITNITVPKKISYKTLQKAISGADIDELNFDLREKYFNKKFGI